MSSGLGENARRASFAFSLFWEDVDMGGYLPTLLGGLTSMQVKAETVSAHDLAGRYLKFNLLTIPNLPIFPIFTSGEYI